MSFNQIKKIANLFSIKLAAKPFCLSNNSILKLINAFPKIKNDTIKLIEQKLDSQLYHLGRLPGQSKEHLGMTGLCGIISGEVLSLLGKYYPSTTIKSGFYKLDKHPRFIGQKVASLHYWLEIDNKIVDFTANQFRPFINEPIDDVEIIPISEANRYMKDRGEYKDVDLPDDFILNWYIENL